MKNPLWRKINYWETAERRQYTALGHWLTVQPAILGTVRIHGLPRRTVVRAFKCMKSKGLISLTFCVFWASIEYEFCVLLSPGILQNLKQSTHGKLQGWDLECYVPLRMVTTASWHFTAENATVSINHKLNSLSVHTLEQLGTTCKALFMLAERQSWRVAPKFRKKFAPWRCGENGWVVCSQCRRCDKIFIIVACQIFSFPFIFFIAYRRVNFAVREAWIRVSPDFAIIVAIAAFRRVS